MAMFFSLEEKRRGEKGRSGLAVGNGSAEAWTELLNRGRFGSIRFGSGLSLIWDGSSPIKPVEPKPNHYRFLRVTRKFHHPNIQNEQYMSQNGFQWLDTIYGFLFHCVLKSIKKSLEVHSICMMPCSMRATRGSIWEVTNENSSFRTKPFTDYQN